MPQPFSLHRESHGFDVVVIGGGMAGLCAAIASARNGARTALVHDRPVFGGNASSEIRMWICGAHGKFNKESGILEEIQLENQYRNHGLNFSVWDSVLYEKIFFQPGLTPFLNCSVLGATMTGEAIASVEAWELTSQTFRTIGATQFIDCSGDSILAALTPAEARSGREANLEFDEDIEPATADSKTMGNSLLLQLRKTSLPQAYVAPKWAYKFTTLEDVQHRIGGVDAHNWWWVEVGGLSDTVKDAEGIRDDLMKVAYGVWDYLKNHAPEKDKAANWAIEWIGSLPGKRENRRYIGDHTLTQNDIRAEGRFEDTVAYGGWSMDDHHPAGVFYPGRPTIFHPAPSPYGIPVRSLYSRNVPNLLFAGRNISVTHAALSSTRVMATCAVIGQAAGTAAALCIQERCAPRDLSTGDKLRKLQIALMDDDAWLPGLPRPVAALAQSATLVSESDTSSLLDGTDRELEDGLHAWEAPVSTPIEFRWEAPVNIGGARIVFDSNLMHTKRMPCSYPQPGGASRVPKQLVRQFVLEARDESGRWSVVHRECNNYQRLVRIPLGITATALRLTPEATWGAKTARIFSFEPVKEFEQKIPAIAAGPSFAAVRAAFSAEDFAPPENGLESAASAYSA